MVVIDTVAGESARSHSASMPPIDPAWREWEVKLRASCPGYRAPPRLPMLVSTSKNSPPSDDPPATASDVLSWQSEADRRSWELFNGVLMQQLQQAQVQAQLMQRGASGA